MGQPCRGAAWLLWFVSVPAVASTQAQLSGVVHDESDAVVPNAAVTAVSEQTGFRRSARTQEDGGYVIPALPPGTYKLTVRKEGFRTLARLGVVLAVAQRARVDFALSVGSVREVVTVSSDTAPQDAEGTPPGTLVSREWVDRVPLNGRGLLALLELAPGTLATPANTGEAGQFTFGGQRPNAHQFTVDGLSANGGVSGGGLPGQFPGGTLPGMTAFGGLQGVVSLEALDELRVHGPLAPPEYGRRPGAQVSVRTRSGSNSRHGSAFFQGRHAALDANDWFTNRLGQGRAPLRLGSFGGSFGGPVRRDRTFYHLSYEALRLTQPRSWRAAVPSRSTRQQAGSGLRDLLALFPEPNGPDLGNGLAEWTGSSARPLRMDSGSVRLDHLLTERLTLFARHTETASGTQFGAGQVQDLSLPSRSLAVGATAVLTPALVLDMRIGLSHVAATSFWRPHGSAIGRPCLTVNAPGQVEVPCAALYRFAIGGVGQFLVGTDSDNQQGQQQWLATASWLRGRHQLRFGTDHRRLTPRRGGPGTSVSVTVPSFTDLLAGRNLAVATNTAEAASLTLHDHALHVQDTWRATPRLTLTGGLRWELAVPPETRTGMTVLPMPGVTAPLPFPGNGGPSRTGRAWRMNWHALAPRLGLALRLDEDGRWVLRAGGGVHYDASLAAAVDPLNGGPFNSWRLTQGSPEPLLAPAAPLTLGYRFAPDLRLPVVRHTNVLIERSLGQHDVLAVGYAGAQGRHLLRRELNGPTGPGLQLVSDATSRGWSRYHALQVQWRRRPVRGLQASASYSWGHSLDNASSDSALFWTAPGSTGGDRGSSDFDVRHALTGAVSLDLPSWLRGWAVDGIVRARTGFPIDVLGTDSLFGLSQISAFRPDLVPGVPVWLRDASVPGGRRLNPAAFADGGFRQGSLGRNALRGFGMAQVDVAVRRTFRVREGMALQARVEAFNALNRAHFADPVRYLSSPLFGQPTSMLNLMMGSGSPGGGLAPAFQAGGARSLQVALRLQW